MKKQISEAKIVFLGAGFMAGAVIAGMVQGGVCPPENIRIKGGKHPEKAQALADKYGAGVAQDGDIKQADVIVLAFKPQSLPEAMEQYSSLISPGTTVISLLAGYSCAALEGYLPWCALVRTMPNLALSVGAGATGYCLGTLAGESDAAAAEAIFGAAGVVVRVCEAQIGEVTAISGSGPAYFCLLAESIIKTAQERGVDGKTARELAVQTLLGAALLVSEDADPQGVRARISSKGGATLAATDAMSAAGFESAVKAGYEACVRRSAELGK